MIKRRPYKERQAHYDGQIAAYDLMLKTWPVSKHSIKTFRQIAASLKEMDKNEYLEQERK